MAGWRGAVGFCWALAALWSGEYVRATPTRSELLCANLKIYIHYFPPPPDMFPFLTANAEVPAEWSFLDPKVDWNSSDLAKADFLGISCAADLPETHVDCYRMENAGQGTGPVLVGDVGLELFKTHQYSMHTQFYRYVIENCRADSVEEADAFLVAFPGNMLSVFAFKGGETRRQAMRYISHLQKKLHKHPSWRMHQGLDFLIPLPRPYGLSLNRKHWGEASWVSLMGPLEEGLKFFGAPFPTSFHPRSDAEVRQWMEYLLKKPRRRETLMLVGATGRHDFRKPLVDVCISSERCNYQEVSNFTGGGPLELSMEYLDWTFSIHPPGDQPPRKAFFDSLVAGCIPIVFEGQLGVRRWPEQQSLLPSNAYAHYFRRGDVKWIHEVALVANSWEEAMSFANTLSEGRIAELQNNVLKYIPKLLVWDLRQPFDEDMTKWTTFGPYNVQAHTLRAFKRKIERKTKKANAGK
eukprot:scaffold3581_cov252-Pinguiococcus_pyrenoidosus.AAC.21